MAAKAPRNHAIWLGPAICTLGLVTYFVVFSRWPATRDFPWVNLPVIAAGLALSVLALGRAWPRGGRQRAAGGVGLGVSAAFSALLVWYCFVFSSPLPAPASALGVGERVPAVVLTDDRGHSLGLGVVSDTKTILVFYRGYW